MILTNQLMHWIMLQLFQNLELLLNFMLMTTLDFGQCLIWNWASRALHTAIKYSRDFSSGFKLTIYDLIQNKIIFRQKRV